MLLEIIEPIEIGEALKIPGLFLRDVGADHAASYS